MSKTTEEGHSMIKIIEVTLGEEMLEEHKILEVDVGVMLEVTILEEVQVGLEKDSTLEF